MSSWQVFRDGATRIDARDQPGDYRPPPRDESIAKIVVNRPCIITMPGDREPTRFDTGCIVSLPRWMALEAIQGGRCEFVK